jgi:DNA-binding response OmpR family regulator
MLKQQSLPTAIMSLSFQTKQRSTSRVEVKPVAKVLTIEDDGALRTMLADWLKREMHEVESVSNGGDALHRLRSFRYDLVILDLGLPDIDGFDILEEMRKRNCDVPVLILTGKQTIDDKERGLELGADDYLTKPFHVRELLARIKAILRRPRTALPTVMTCGVVTMNTVTHEVAVSGELVSLTPKEYLILEFFLRHPNQLFSTEALLERVWRAESEASEEAIVACIGRLRKKLNSKDSTKSLISTVYGAGYILRTD